MFRQSQMRNAVVAAAALLLASASVVHAQAVPTQTVQPAVQPPAEQIPEPRAEDRALLKDAIDIHAHLDPDSFGPHSNQAARRLDVIDMGRRAKAAGMRGFVIKQHYDQTAQIAYLTDKEVPGIEAFGMLCMNLTVGGFNVAAVNHFAEVKGGLARIVSMPTWDSENNILKSKDPSAPRVVVSRNGELVPEAKAVIAAIAAAKDRDTGATLALATGHVSAEEGLMVVKEARKAGIKRIVVTHAMGAPVNMSLAQMKEAAKLGAFIEFVGGFVVGERASFTPKQYYDAMRAIGPKHVILSSDSGQMGRPYPDDMVALVAGELRDLGMSKADLRKMMVENPATLLGIPQAKKQ